MIRKGFIRLHAILGCALAVLLVAACTSSPTGQGNSTHPVQGGTITTSVMGVPASAQAPNWLLPVITGPTFTGPNIGAQQLVWRALITYNNDLTINWPGSIAESATPNSNDTSLLVKMHQNWKWSDGKPVTAQDVQFEWNLIKASCPSVTNCSYGAESSIFPFAVKDFRVLSNYEFAIDFNAPFNMNTWEHNHLELLSPLPAQVMSINPATGKAICTDLYCNNPQQALADYKYLASVADVPTNKVWSVVDGPWKLGPWVTNQYYTFLRNTKYTGGPLAHANKLVWQYYTSDSAEFNALETGAIDVGYVPLSDAARTAISGYKLYKFNPTLVEQINLNEGNLTNPNPAAKCTRPICKIFGMLPVRQALAEAINQPEWIKKVFLGYALPHYSTISPTPVSFYGPYKNYEPYPPSISKGTSTLEAAGFKLQNGVMTYEGPAGANLPPQGSKISFTFGYPSGDTLAAREALLWQAALKSMGIQVNLKVESYNALIAQTNQSPATINSWDATNLTNLWYIYSNIVSTGDVGFACNGGANFNGYCTKQMDNVVAASLHLSGSAGTNAFYSYVKLAADQLPSIPIPTPDSLLEVKDSVGGWTAAQLNPAFITMTFPEQLWVSGQS
jgi:peptide/nickel transport system substrate-binding protein